MSSLASSLPISGSSMWTSTLIMVVAYGVIITDKLNRAIVALLGAGAMIVFGLLTQDEAIAGVDFNTLGLLTGMMVLVAISRRTGMFEYVAIWTVQRAQAEPWAVLLLLGVATAILSALLDNVTTVLLIVPVTLAVTKTLELPAYPFLFTEIVTSNIGGTATLIGDPPNILIGSQVGLSFVDFLINLAPIAAFILVIQLGIVHVLWGRNLQAHPEAKARLMGTDPSESIKDPKLLRHSLAVLFLVMIAFTLGHSMGLEAATIAMVGAAMLLLFYCLDVAPEQQTSRTHHVLSEVEWITIFFFVGLFVIVHGVEASGVLTLLANTLASFTAGDVQLAATLVLWASAILSAIVDNIPFVATMIPVIRDMGPVLGGAETLDPLWWSLALGTCLGGNGSLVGASANLIVAGIAEREGIRFPFLKFTLIAFPMMILSILFAQVYVSLRYF